MAACEASSSLVTGASRPSSAPSWQRTRGPPGRSSRPASPPPGARCSSTRETITPGSPTGCPGSDFSRQRGYVRMLLGRSEPLDDLSRMVLIAGPEFG